MTTLKSFLKTLFPFKGYKVCVLETEKDIIIGLKNRRITGTCPTCGKRCPNIEHEYQRLIRDLDLAECKCYLRFYLIKTRCSCGYRGEEKLDFLAKYDWVTV